MNPQEDFNHDREYDLDNDQSTGEFNELFLPSKARNECAPGHFEELLARIDRWEEKEEIGRILDNFKSALLLASDPEKEFEVYRTFLEAASRVDWCCVNAAERLILEKLENLSHTTPASSEQSGRYFQLLEAAIGCDDSPPDVTQLLRSHIDRYSNKETRHIGYREALEKILSWYREGLNSRAD